MIQITQMVKDLFDWKQKINTQQKKNKSAILRCVGVYGCQRGYPKNKYSEM